MYKGIKINKILVAVDGSENSKRAGDYAIKLGKDLHADVIALHVIPTGKYIDEGNLEKGSKYDYAYLDKFGKESDSAGVHLEIDIKRATRSSVVDEILEYEADHPEGDGSDHGADRPAQPRRGRSQHPDGTLTAPFTAIDEKGRRAAPFSVSAGRSGRC